MDSAQCKLDAKSTEITVGEVIYLDCLGDLSSFSLAAQFKIEPTYTFHFIRFDNLEKNHARLMMTSYRVGEHSLSQLNFAEGDKQIQIAIDPPAKIKVQSVLDPQNPPKGLIGPLGPVQFPLPLWFWLALLAGITTVAVAVWFKQRSLRLNKKLMAEMNLDQYAMAPGAYLFQGLRKIQRQLEATTDQAQLQKMIHDLDFALRLYLARKFLIPTLAWNDAVIVQHVDKHTPIFVNEHRVQKIELKKILSEIKKAQTQERLSINDLQQLTSMSRLCVDYYEMAFELEHKRGES